MKAYYQHWIAGAFAFPTAPKLDALQEALRRLEAIETLKTEMRSKSDELQ